MKYFLLKRPTNLAFIQEEYMPGDPLPNISQARFIGDKSNTKLVQCKDGRLYIRTGDTMLLLKCVPTREASIIRLTEHGGDIVDKVCQKWFLEKKR